LESANTAIDSILDDNQDRLSDEFRVARARLSSAEKGAIEQAMNDGWVSANTASKLIEEVDFNLTSHAPAIESPVPARTLDLPLHHALIMRLSSDLRLAQPITTLKFHDHPQWRL
jgi:hypothetical protein